MKERPILFNAEMVRAILAGRKTKTRLVVQLSGSHDGWVTGTQHGVSWKISAVHSTGVVKKLTCPYGQPGDRLWVRETWLQLDADHRNPGPGRGPAEGDRGIVYKASYDPITDHRGEEIRREFGYRWRPSIHMPRWASRITLEVVSVRVERVQDISEEDAKAEGVCCAPGHPHGSDHRYRGAFEQLWDSINKKRGYGWESNPFCWVIEFKQIERNE